MTNNEFREVLKILAPDLYNACILSHLALPEIANRVATHCFVWNINNKETDELRSQIKHICEKGVFDFTN